VAFRKINHDLSKRWSPQTGGGEWFGLWRRVELCELSQLPGLGRRQTDCLWQREDLVDDLRQPSANDQVGCAGGAGMDLCVQHAVDCGEDQIRRRWTNPRIFHAGHREKPTIELYLVPAGGLRIDKLWHARRL
jgi:hypothetical protein